MTTTTVPNNVFRAEVVRTRKLTAGLARITFGGDGLADFLTTGVGDEYLRVFFPHTDDRRSVNLPFPTDNGGWDFPEGVEPAPLRTYTVRAVRPEDNEVDIDFVIHDGGVAAAWALRAEPGDVVGLNSPNGLYEPPEDLTWQLLVADQTGLPAVSRLLENIPAGVRTRVLLEVPDADHILELPKPAGDASVEVEWFFSGNGHGPSEVADLLRSALTAGELAAGLEGGYIWVAGETKALRDVRKFLRKEHRLPATRYKVIGYWTFDAEAWRARYAALDEEVRKDLMVMWQSDRDEEEIEDEYVERLEKLGL
jgi:NADPH-dependent ferric siderophore reductase